MAHAHARSSPLEGSADFDSFIAPTVTRHISQALNEAHLDDSLNPSDHPHRGAVPSGSAVYSPSWFSTTEFRTVGEDSVHVSGTMPRMPGLGLGSLLDSPISSMAGFNGQPGQRRSMLRSGGTASHPDLATLVRSAKEKARKDKSIASSAFNPEGLEGASFSGPGDPTTAPMEALDKPRERRKTETSRRAPIPAFDRSAHSYGRNAGAASAQTASSQSVETEVYAASNNEGTRTRSSSRGDSEGFVEVPGGGSSWSNTMRKTSSFFRRRFGSGARVPGPSPGSIGEDDPFGSRAPPVPAIPASFRPTEPNLPSAPASAPPSGASNPESSDQRTIRGDSMGRLSNDCPAPPARRPSVRRASSTVAATVPAKVGLTPAPRRLPTTAKPKSKRDAMSNTTNKSLPASPHPSPLPEDALDKYRGKGKARAMDDDHSRKPSLAQMSDASQSTTEEDRLKRDLRAWGLGADGVLGGSSGEAGALDLRRSRSHTDPPPSPRTLTHRPATSPGPTKLGFAEAGRAKMLPPPMSTPTFGGDVAGMPDWGQVETPRGRTKMDETAFTMSSRDLSPSPRSPLTPRGEDSEDGEWETPSIRLVSSPTITRLHPGSSPLARQEAAALPIIDKDVLTEQHEPGGSNLGSGITNSLDPAVAAAHPRTMPLTEVLIKPAGKQPEPQPDQARRGSSPSVVVSPAEDSLAGSGSGGTARMTANRHSVVQYPASAVMPWTHTGASKSRSVSGLSGLSTQSSFEKDPDALSVLEGSTEVALDENARQMAVKCWDEDESFMKREKISEWLGSGKPLNNAALVHYMDRFDFAELRIDAAFRKLCEKLYLKGETQQVDRILEQFSRRFWDQNKSRVYASIDLVHAISYSLLLLNTDLHVVDSTSRMTRNQFVRNTMEVVHVQTGLDWEGHPSQDTPAEGLPPRVSNENLANARPSMDKWRDHLHRGAGGGQRARRSASIASWRSGAARGQGSELNSAEAEEPIGRLSGVSFDRAWEQEMEGLLKDVYTSIKSQPIFQSAGSTEAGGSPYGSWSGINRAVSRRSHQSLGSAERNLTNKRTSLRGLGGLLAATSADSFRSSSPTPSAATSMSGTYSSNTLGSHPYTNLTSPSIGFASNLSHSIIREQQEDEASESGHSTPDEELALLGAPWAKEGLLQRKHYWESLGKRSKDKTWAQNFVVIQRGELRMFKFGEGGGSGTTTGMGGGNWMANAQAMGELTLAHALCSAMPAGYNRERPHTFVLTLSSGSSYFFQAGTADLVNEWVSTCNYWAARLSREPLTGGVSNMEYGWNRILPEDDSSDREELASVFSGVSGHSYRSRRSKMSFQTGNGLNSNDRIFINDWKPPQAPSTASTLSEDGQLEALRRHVEHMQGELEQHNTLQKPMIKLYTPRSVNAQKSQMNWERKSQFLLSEIVKYTTYIEALESGIRLRNQRRDEKQISKLLSAADDNDVDYIDIDGSSRTPNDSLSSSVQLDTTRRVPLGNRPESAGPSVSTHKTSDSSQPYFDAVSTSPRSSSPH